MHRQDNNHAIKDLIDSLNEEGLRALDLVIVNSMHPHSAHLLRGRVEMALQMKFDVCPCGESHDPERELLDQAPLPSQKAPIMPPSPELVEAIPPSDAELMIQYGIEIDPNYGKPVPEGTVLPQLFRCINCGKGYPSLEDRMRRAPGIDGCGGCQHKSAFG